VIRSTLVGGQSGPPPSWIIAVSFFFSTLAPTWGKRTSRSAEGAGEAGRVRSLTAEDTPPRQTIEAQRIMPAA
jgi:hypothetical protein